MLRGKFFLLGRAQQVGSVYIPARWHIETEQTPELSPPRSAHTSLSSDHHKAPQELPHISKDPLLLRDEQNLEAGGRQSEKRRKAHRNGWALGPGGPGLTWEKLSPLSGWHCSSTRSTAPVVFLIFSACWARYRSSTGTPRERTSVSVSEFTMSITHTGLLRSQLPAMALNR